MSAQQPRISAVPPRRESDSADQVSLRMLNQHSGRVVAAVVDTGRAITVTDRGRPVAQIVAIPQDETPLERLRREGRLRVARRQWPLTPQLPATAPGTDPVSALLDEREEDR